MTKAVFPIFYESGKRKKSFREDTA